MIGILLALMGGCAFDRQCDPDQTLVHDICIEDPVPDSDAAATAADTDPLDDTCPDPTAAFGAACSVADDCACDLDWCQTQFVATPFCTRTGCLDDPSICPAGWTCSDLSVYAAGLPSICEPR